MQAGSSRSRRSSSALALVLLASGAPASAQARRLNPPLAETSTGRVVSLAVGAGGRVVYQLEPRPFEPLELRGAPLDGSSAWIHLSPPPVFGESAASFRLSPDGTRAVYSSHDIADDDTLLSVPVDGSQGAVSISHFTLFGLLLASYRVSADSARVVYVARDSLTPYGIYSTPIDGSSAPIHLEGTLVAGGNVSSSFALAAFTDRAIFLADKSTDGVDELWSVPISGATSPVKLNPALAAGGDVSSSFAVTPDGGTVVYVADQDTDEVFELYSVPGDGSAPAQKLSGALVTGGDVATAIGGLQISPDGSRVVYLADADTDGVSELYSVPIDASASPVKLNAALVAGGNVSAGARISPDASRVVYRADQNTDGVLELFSVPLDGSTPAVRLNGALVPGGGVRDFETGFAISADSARVVYVADELTDEVQELFSVPLDASSAAVRLSAPLVAGGDVGLPVIAPDSTRVAYTADQELDGQIRLYVVPLDGGAPPAALDAPHCSSGGVSNLQFEPGSSRIAYMASLGSSTPPVELFGVPSDGSALPVELSADPALVEVTGDVTDLVVGPSGRLAYSASLEQNECAGVGLFGLELDGPFSSTSLSGAEILPQLRLITPGGRVVYGALPAGFYSAPLDASSPPLLLSPLASFNDILLAPIVLAPDGTTAVFLGGTPSELYAAPADGALPARRLNPPHVANGGVFGDFLVDPTGRFVVYRADQDADEVIQLYRVPLDGSQKSRRLSGKLPAGGDVGLGFTNLPPFLISADGKRVVYAADESADGVVELYSVELDPDPKLLEKSAPPLRRKLNPPFVAGGDVTEFLITPDGQRVVYRADQDLDERFELYSVPIDGSAHGVRLNPALVNNGDVSSGFRISADGARVVYLADQTANDRVELWSVPVGGGPAVRLNAPFAADRDVVSFQIDAEGARVVYLADQVANGKNELFSAPIDASQAPLQLSAPLAADRDVSGFQVAPRGRFVVYSANPNTLGVSELFAAADDGSRPVQRVNGPLVSGGGVREFAFAPDGERVVYRADELADEQDELFLSYLSPPYRRWP